MANAGRCDLCRSCPRGHALDPAGEARLEQVGGYLPATLCTAPGPGQVAGCRRGAVRVDPAPGARSVREPLPPVIPDAIDVRRAAA